MSAIAKLIAQARRLPPEDHFEDVSTDKYKHLVEVFADRRLTIL
jgi:hypothetical protein